MSAAQVWFAGVCATIATGALDQTPGGTLTVLVALASVGAVRWVAS